MHYFIHPRESLKNLQTATETRGEECAKIEDELLALYSDAGLFVKPEQLSQRGGAMYSEAACALAESIHTDNRKIHVINAYNNGAIPFMADRDVVETRAIVGKDGAEMLPAKETGGEYVKGLMQSVKAYEHLTVTAAINGCKNAAISALMANPLILDYDAATACFNEMLDAHRDFLPQF
jgi:6-phospho-beta-glucosidase